MLLPAVPAPPAPTPSPEAFAVRLPLFEGPSDLLLFFIERDELDIHDIPIARLTADFMAYLRQLEKLNVEVAADFILTAATLMRIKARLLLPRPVVDAAGQEIDPRQELVQHLLEYRRFKGAVAELARMEADMLARFPRGNAEAELRALAKGAAAAVTPEDELQDVTLYKLLRVFERAMARYEQVQARPRHTVFVSDYTVSGQKDYLRLLAGRNRFVGFAELMQAFPTDRLGLIYTFIALLELLQLRELRLEETAVEPDAEPPLVAFNAFRFRTAA